jgi:hypothetical protein
VSRGEWDRERADHRLTPKEGGAYPEVNCLRRGQGRTAIPGPLHPCRTRNEGTASAISPGFIDAEMSSWTEDSIPTDAMIKVEDIVRLRRPGSTSAINAALPHSINRAGGKAYHASAALSRAQAA